MALLEGFYGVEGRGKKRRGPFGEGAAGFDKVGGYGDEFVAAERVSCGEVQREEVEVVSSIAEDVIRRVRWESAGRGGEAPVDRYGRRRYRWHSACGVGRGECEDASGRIRISQGVEFSHGGDVAGAEDGTAHDQHRFGAEEGGRVFCRGEGEISQGPDGDDGDGVGRIFGKDSEDL